MRAIGKMVYAGVLAAVFTSAAVHATNSQTRACVKKWDRSEAKDYCSSATMTYVGPHINYCSLSGSCSITVEVDGTSTTFTPSVDETGFPSVFDDLDICFAEDEDAADTSGFSATVKGGCASTETDSDDAVDDGLSTGD